MDKLWEPNLNDTITFFAGSSILGTGGETYDFTKDTEMRVFTYVGNHALFLEYADCNHNTYGFPDRSIQVFLTDLQDLFHSGKITHIPQQNHSHSTPDTK